MTQVLAINDVIRASIVCNDNEQTSYNTLHYQVTGVGVAPATLEDFANSYSTLVAPKIKPMLYNGATFWCIDAQVISPLPLMARVLQNGDFGVGTGGAIGAPRQCAPLIRYKTDFAGPGFRGRNYMPFMSSTHLTGYGFASVAYQALAVILADAQLLYTAVAGGGRTATVRLGLFRRAGSIFTPVTSTSTGAEIATQKRRGNYGRTNLPPG